MSLSLSRPTFRALRALDLAAASGAGSSSSAPAASVVVQRRTPVDAQAQARTSVLSSADVGGARHFSTTRPAAAAGKVAVSTNPRSSRAQNRQYDMNELEEFRFDDVPTLGHMILERQRELLKYFRLVEFELPKLKAFRKPFTPPPSSSYLRFRMQHYQGEPHPAARKVVLSVPVSALVSSGALKSAEAKHKFLLLAGPRWRPLSGAPSVAGDSRVGVEAKTKEAMEDGEVVISSELLPTEKQNMKWCSDALDRLLKEANDLTDPMTDLPLDRRHLLSASRKRGAKGLSRRISLRDFPKEWLRPSSSAAAPRSSSPSPPPSGSTAEGAGHAATANVASPSGSPSPPPSPSSP